MRRQEKSSGIAALVLLILYISSAVAMEHSRGNGQTRNIIGFSLCLLPLLSLVLSLMSSRTWMGIVGLFLSIPLSLFVVAAVTWTILYGLHPHKSHMHPNQSGQQSNTALHRTPPPPLPMPHSEAVQAASQGGCAVRLLGRSGCVAKTRCEIESE